MLDLSSKVQPKVNENKRASVLPTISETGDVLTFSVNATEFANACAPSSSGKDVGVNLIPAIMTDSQGRRYQFRIGWVGIKAL